MTPVGSAKGKMGVSDPPSIRVKIASIRGHIMLEMERCFKLFSSFLQLPDREVLFLFF